MLVYVYLYDMKNDTYKNPFTKYLENIQMRSDWVFPICNGNERLKKSDGTKVHPTQKPESILHRILV